MFYRWECHSTFFFLDGVGYISFQDAMECILLCLKNESCWTVLETVLHGLCGLLQNKAIVIGNIQQNSQLAVDGQYVVHLEELAKTLCSLISEVLVRRNITAMPPDLTRSDIQSTILSVISCLVSYHNWLGVSRQRQILRYGRWILCIWAMFMILSPCNIFFRDMDATFNMHSSCSFIL